MRLVNLLALTDATLVNNPFVSSFNNIVFEAKALKRGDLFIAFDEDSIEDAILNGAYGIMFDKPTQISDREIAWIKVENLDKALAKLLRFRLIDKEVRVYKTDEVTLKLALQISTESSFMALSGDTRSLGDKLWHIEPKTTLLFSPTLCNEAIFSDVEEISNKSNKEEIEIVDQTLFETSFIFDDIYYERELISPLFIPSLETLLNLYKELDINYRIKKFTQIDNFEAHFINKNFKVKDFGTTERVIIFEKNSTFFDLEYNFLEQHAKWLNVIYLLESSNIEKYQDRQNLYFYSNTHQLTRFLKENSFHFALIVGRDREILSILETSQEQLTLEF